MAFVGQEVGQNLQGHHWVICFLGFQLCSDLVTDWHSEA